MPIPSDPVSPGAQGGSAATGGRGGGTGGTSSSGGASSTGGATGGSPIGTGGAAPGGSGGATDVPETGGTGGSPGDTGGELGPLPPGERKVVLLVGDTNTNDQSRLQLIEILTSMKGSHGIVLEVLESQKAKASDLMDKALIIAGPNNNYCSDDPDPAFKTLPVPIIVSRDCRTTKFGLGTMMNTQEYREGLPVKISIESDHPLAAGLKGVVPVLSTKCRLVRGSKLGPDAIKIAKPPADATPVEPNSWAIFAYEKDGMMADGLRAPAKRVGFFWHRPSAVTPEGKQLFQAAVDWALRP